MLYGIQRPLQQRLVQAGPPAARADRLRRVLVSLVHAPPRRAPGERLVRRQESGEVRLKAERPVPPVVVAGCGPAGAMVGYLLARAGIAVTVFEKHADFLRDFRGDTVPPLDARNPRRARARRSLSGAAALEGARRSWDDRHRVRRLSRFRSRACRRSSRTSRSCRSGTSSSSSTGRGCAPARVHAEAKRGGRSI